MKKFLKIKYLVAFIIIVTIICVAYTPVCTNIDSNENLSIHALDFPDYSFKSKEELCVIFYADFYNYILSVGGKSFLEQNNIYDFGQFLKLNTTWTGGPRGMAFVGDITANYFLTPDPGGKLEDQINKPGFIGYCLRTNRYPKFIYFLQEFFYWWRLDEGYTDFSDNYKKHGSDFLYESSAPAIDTAKFFYFNKDTLPKYFFVGNHIPPMYDRIPYVNDKNQ